jgi:hypothetical protein
MASSTIKNKKIKITPGVNCGGDIGGSNGCKYNNNKKIKINLGVNCGGDIGGSNGLE